MEKNVWLESKDLVGDLIKKSLEEADISYKGIKITKTIEEPPNSRLGDLSTTIAFNLSKKLNKTPIEIAKKIKRNLKTSKLIKETKQVGPYVNFFLSNEFKKKVIKNVLEKKEKYGSGENKKEKVIVEHTSANPNKPIHMGSARCAILGDIMARILKFYGYNVEIQNYIDDLGRQSAVALYGYENFYETLTKEEKRRKDDFWVGLLYSKAAQYIKEHPEEEKEVKRTVKEIEEGVGRSKLKEELVEKSLKAQLETCFRMNIFYDLLAWERDIVRSKLFENALNEMKKSNKVYKIEKGEDKGCTVINMSDYKEKLGETFKPYKVIVRSDGTATYTGKDIAYQEWKFGLNKAALNFKEYFVQPNNKKLYTMSKEGKEMDFGNADKVINVIGYEQKYPQQVVYYAMKILGHEKAFENSHHLHFKWVWLPGQEKFAGRTGSWIGYHTDAVLDKAHKIVYERVRENNPNLEKEMAKEIAEKIAIGAVRFYITKSDLEKKIVFNYEDALSLEGETGPYIQYACVRAKKILEKMEKRGKPFEYSLNSMEEKELIKKIAKFPEIVKKASEEHKPNLLARYAYNLSLKFNNFYEKCPVLKAENEELVNQRLDLVEASKIALENSLNLLGIEVPKLM